METFRVTAQFTQSQITNTTDGFAVKRKSTIFSPLKSAPDMLFHRIPYVLGLNTPNPPDDFAVIIIRHAASTPCLDDGIPGVDIVMHPGSIRLCPFLLARVEF